MLKSIRLTLTDVVGIEFLPEFTGLFKQVGNAVAKPDGSFILKFWFFKQDFLFDLFGLANYMRQTALSVFGVNRIVGGIAIGM